jgi:hypothetical protein
MDDAAILSILRDIAEIRRRVEYLLTLESGTGLSALGAANQLLGVNNGATGLEYKSLLGTTNQITVTHAANSITLALPQNIHTAATPTFGALNVGSASGAGTGDVKMSGAVRQSTALGCRAYRTSTQTIPNATWTALSLNAERFDDDNIHDTVTNNSRLTCKTAGVYYIFGNITWVLNSTGVRGVAIRLNGTTFIADLFVQATSSVVGNVMNVSCIANLNVNDYVELMAYQNSGGNLNIDYSASHYIYSDFGMVRIA